VSDPDALERLQATPLTGARRLKLQVGQQQEFNSLLKQRDPAFFFPSLLLFAFLCSPAYQLGLAVRALPSRTSQPACLCLFSLSLGSPSLVAEGLNSPWSSSTLPNLNKGLQ